MSTASQLKLIFLGVFAVIAISLLLILNPMGQVDPGHRGVLIELGKVNDEVLPEGFYWRLPIVQKVVQVPIRTTAAETVTPAYTKDTQIMDVVSTLNLRLDPEHVNRIYQDYGDRWMETIVYPVIPRNIKNVLGQYESTSVIENREKIESEIRLKITEELSPRLIIVEDFGFNDLSFSKAYEESIEAKQVAYQNSLTAVNNLETTKTNALAREASATGEAKAIAIQAQAITQQGGSDYLALKWIEAWKEGGSQVPKFLGDAANEFMLNLEGF